MKKITFIAACALLAGASTAFAHGNAEQTDHAAHSAHGTAAAEQMPWGQAGQSAKVSRTITLKMSDDMRFSPAHIEVKRGQTLRLRVENKGQVMHEIVLGTPAMLDEHAAMMLKSPDMAHDTAYMEHVAPGKKGELVWNFNRAGNFDFACLIAGHFQAGMRGTIRVTE